MFIVIEGIDGCGKTTQARLLHDWLIEEGQDVFLTAEPTNSIIGKCLKAILSSGVQVDPHALALLFTSDRYEHIKKEIEPALRDKKIVITERYYHSTVAYQSAQGVDRNWLLDINSFAIENKPDLTFLLDISPEAAIPKIQEKDMGFREIIDKLDKEIETARKFFQNNRKALYGKLQQKQAIERIRESERRLEELEKKREMEVEKYIKFEKFERPTTLEADTLRYNVFLVGVRENYLGFNDVTKIDGEKPVEMVFGDIKKAVKKQLWP
jgi:dTMP kinase